VEDAVSPWRQGTGTLRITPVGGSSTDTAITFGGARHNLPGALVDGTHVFTVERQGGAVDTIAMLVSGETGLAYDDDDGLWAPIPISSVTLKGKVTLSATLVIAPEVDPEHPGAYTRGGLDVAFRPHHGKYAKPRDGKTAKHAKPRPFFSSARLYGQSERLLREDGHKWEPCLRNEERLLATSLSEPCFDVYYNHRESGMKSTDPKPIPYAFVVGLKAPKVPDLYDQVVRAYANVLVPIQPKTRIQVRT